MSNLQIRTICTSVKHLAKVVPSNLKGKSKSSQEWLTRQLSDPYVEKAKILNYRCRSVFKLLEIDDKYKILNPGHVVIDCGAAPGSWSQVASKRTNADGTSPEKPQGTVVSVDLLQIHPIKGVIIFGGTDFRLEATQEKIKNSLEGRLANCVLSDMAPNATGVKILDQENIVNLCYSALRFALSMSVDGASLLVKVWDGAGVPKLEKDIMRFYSNVKRIKPKASRSDSAELFILAREFKGLQK